MGGWLLIDYRYRMSEEEYLLGLDLPPGVLPPGLQVPPEAELRETEITSEAQLREALAHYRREHPSPLLSLVSPSQQSLSIGLGPELSGLEWREPSPDWHSEVAINPHPVAEKAHLFCDGGGGSVFQPDELLPTDQVIEAVVSYYRDQRRPESLQWASPFRKPAHPPPDGEGDIVRG
jgi:hypothetical protein